MQAFEQNDRRKDAWLLPNPLSTQQRFCPFKYKEGGNNGSGAEYYMVLRLAEQYLIRAEARARQNKLTGINGAVPDINSIRIRAGLTPTSATTQQGLLDAVAQERRIELFVEWGHRWMDLKRTGKASAVLSPIKQYWDETDTLYPIPFSEIQLNPNMTQNQNY
jgi:hypothetical protein